MNIAYKNMCNDMCSKIKRNRKSVTGSKYIYNFVHWKKVVSPFHPPIAGRQKPCRSSTFHKCRFGINGVPFSECGGKVLLCCGSGCEEVLPTGNGSQVVPPS